MRLPTAARRPPEGMRKMDKFTVLESVAAPLRIINVDTDMIIPKQYLKTIERTGLGRGLFSEMRYRDDGSGNPAFVLNQRAYRNAKILVAGDNFGCGSSREHAPWALKEFGITCVISTTFADNLSARAVLTGVRPAERVVSAISLLRAAAARSAHPTPTLALGAAANRGADAGGLRRPPQRRQ